ncbi:MAG: class II fructose-bisphosphatase [Culicoidibacterales bacterium]
MKRELAIEFSRVTEAAAIASAKYVGCGNKILADEAAVEAMRLTLNEIEMKGEIIIGEGEIDDAPMLFIGEKLGTNTGDELEIAVDPIDGTRMVAMGQANALAVLAVADKGSFMQAPDMYMEKFVVNHLAKDVLDADISVVENVKRAARACNKELKDFVVMTLAKPRHESVITALHQLGVKVYAIADGDVAASVLVCMPDSPIDMYYGIGGAPEGVISAAVVRALDGNMQARLIPRTVAKGDTEENRLCEKEELRRCQEMGVDVEKKLVLNDMVKTDNIIFAATGITDGDLLKGVRPSIHDTSVVYTETLVIRGKSRTVRKIESAHFLERKSEKLQKILEK